MDGKVCVVTGAGRGLGNEMARTLVQSGANELVVLDLVEEQAAAAAKEIEESFVSQGLAPPGEITAVGIGCDVANEESVKAAFQRIKDQFGRVDALVTAAGIVHNYTAEEYPTEKIRQLMDINVMGTWFCALEASKLMPNGGSIILIGSMSGSVSRVSSVRLCAVLTTVPDCQHPPAPDPVQLLQVGSSPHGPLPCC